MGWRMKVKPVRQINAWWEKASDKIRANSYFEVWLESRSATFLKVNTDNGPHTVCRVPNDYVNWFETETMKSIYINIRVLKIIRRLDKKKKEKPDVGAIALLPLLEEKNIQQLP